MRLVYALLLILLTSASVMAQPIAVEPLPGLKHAVSNNAVTLVEGPDGDYLFSFLGLGSDKTWQDISNAAFVLNPGATSWKELDWAEPETKPGRLAASAVSTAGAAWLFGGYTVASNGSEESEAGVYRVRPGESELRWVTDMPVPVEDSVLLVYQDRFIYLVSGWHDLGNVNLVQVLDTQTMSWAQATPWPGAPVFGHSGGNSDGHILICDGVRIQYANDDGPRRFLPSNECWSGSIDPKNYRRIDWRPVIPHPGSARYRMASVGDSMHRVVFAGGSVNPYNFNGIGYNTLPSEAENSVFSFSFETREWKQHGVLPRGTMDHRGLPYSKGWYYLIGGMQGQQTVVNDVYRFRVDP